MRAALILIVAFFITPTLAKSPEECSHFLAIAGAIDLDGFDACLLEGEDPLKFGELLDYNRWPIGHEKETVPGVYYTLLEKSLGWSVWKQETRSGVTCGAVKASGSDSFAYPLGGGFSFHGNKPMIEVYSSYVRATGGVSTCRNKDEYRVSGEKFYNPIPKGRGQFISILEDMDGSSIDLSLPGFRYCNIFTDYHAGKGSIDLTGFNNALASVRQCVASN